MTYRTTQPPQRGDLVRWACYEAHAWPATTPQGESYTYWIRFVERQRRAVKMEQTRMELV